MRNYRLPAVEVNLAAMENNARVLCDVCRQYGISVAGVIKFSDGDPRIAEAYAKGGCAQVAVSRAIHLKGLKDALPGVETFLTRAPAKDDLEETALYADISVHSEEFVLRGLNEAAGRCGTKPGVLLMYDVGDLREGVDNVEELCRLAVLVEKELTNLRLRGIGTNLVCLNGVLPDWDNMSELVAGARAVEEAIGRKLDIVSGGSSSNLLLLYKGINEMPPGINHLRIGGSIANPMNIRLNRGVTFEGMREDTVSVTAEIVELQEKDSVPKKAGKNWAGVQVAAAEDKGRRLRAILAVGSQDIGDAFHMIPMDPDITVIGCSSDHTVIDITDSKREWHVGDAVSFRLRYMAMLRAFCGRHLSVAYVDELPS